MTAAITNPARWTGRILSGIPMLFLAFDAVIKVAQLPVAVEASARLGFSANAVLGLGIVELACLVLYAFPRTAVLGAAILTGYLGGAVETHVRLGDPVFSHVLVPIYVALMLWGGLALRDRRVRALVSTPAT
jgi:hypothetical protein